MMARNLPCWPAQKSLNGSIITDINQEVGSLHPKPLKLNKVKMWQRQLSRAVPTCQFHLNASYFANNQTSTTQPQLNLLG